MLYVYEYVDLVVFLPSKGFNIPQNNKIIEPAMGSLAAKIIKNVKEMGNNIIYQSFLKKNQNNSSSFYLCF